MSTRRKKWAEYDARYKEWAGRKAAPAFVQRVTEHKWHIQVLRPARWPVRSWLGRLFFDPPYIGNAEPYYDGWPGDRRGWLSFTSKEEARDYFQMVNGIIDLEEYRQRPGHEPLLLDERYDLDERGNFIDAEKEHGTNV